MFDLNGWCDTVENGVGILKICEPKADVTVSGKPFPFLPDVDDGPILAHLNYPPEDIEECIRQTNSAFVNLHREGRLLPLA